MRVVVGYPDDQEELGILYRMGGRRPTAGPVLDTARLLALQARTRDVFVHHAIAEYAVRLVLATRDPARFGAPEVAGQLAYGASPRATLGLVAAARATLCRSLRTGQLDTPGGRDVRVLMLTARSGLDDRIRGLDGGADDYLVKPFHLAELLARIRALLRRDTNGTGATLTVGTICLDNARHTVTRDGQTLALTPKEFGVLEYLMTRPGHVISAEELLEHVWDANADPFTQTVRVTVGTLRRKLGDGWIDTVVGRGYRLSEGAP